MWHTSRASPKEDVLGIRPQQIFPVQKGNGSHFLVNGHGPFVCTISYDITIIIYLHFHFINTGNNDQI